METISSTDAARRLGEIFARASRGETFQITQYGRPYVSVGPPADQDPPAPAPKKAPAKKAAAKRPRKTATAG